MQEARELDRPIASLLVALLAGLLPGLFLWSQLRAPTDGGLGLALVAFFVVGGFVGYLGRAPTWLSTAVFLVPLVLLSAQHATLAPDRSAALLPVLGAAVLAALVAVAGGRRFRAAQEVAPEPEEGETGREEGGGSGGRS